MTGQWNRLRLRYRMRESCPTIWWYACGLNPANWISATGTSPATDRPTLAPMMADSEIGVSNTRGVAEPVEQTVGHAEHPAVVADVLAEQDDAFVASHLRGERVVDGCEHRHARHEMSPSSPCSSPRIDHVTRAASSARSRANRGLSTAVT